MPTTAERIAKLRARMEARDHKFESSKIVQTTKARNEADRKEMEKLQAEAAAKKAVENRKLDTAAKLLLGAGVLLVEEPICSRIVATVLPVLNTRDQGRMKPWVEARKVDPAALPFTVDPVVAEAVSATPVEPPAPVEPLKPSESPADDPNWPANGPLPLDPTMEAVVRVFGQIETAELGMVEGLFLSLAMGEDRPLLVQFFANLKKSDDPEVELVGAGYLTEEDFTRPLNG